MSSSFLRRHVFLGALLTLCLGLFLVALWSIDDAINTEPTLYVGTFDVQTSAISFLIFDVETGTEIASKNAAQKLPIASITKLVTASLFYEKADLEATTTITWQDVNTEGAAGRIHAYEEYSYRELIYPLLLESSNDAATAILRVSPDLLERMEAYTSSLGLQNTYFKDTSGLSDENTSTAYELAILITALFKKEPHIFDITRLSQYLGTHTGWINNNPLSKMDGFVGGKHGFTYEAGKTTVAFFDETFSSGQTRTLGYILLGSSDLVGDIERLREEVHQNVRYE